MKDFIKENRLLIIITIVFMIIGIVLALSSPACAAAFKCGNRVVYEGERAVTLINKCGRPDAQDTRVVTRQTPKGAPIYIYVTELIYEQRKGFYSITVIEGKITKIEFIYH